MVKIELTRDRYNLDTYELVLPSGTVIEVNYIDEDGDAVLSDEQLLRYGFSYVFKGTYKQIEDSDQSVSTPAQRYTVTVKANTLRELHKVIDSLPEDLVDSATLHIN